MNKGASKKNITNSGKTGTALSAEQGKTEEGWSGRERKDVRARKTGRAVTDSSCEAGKRGRLLCIFHQDPVWF